MVANYNDKIKGELSALALLFFGFLVLKMRNKGSFVPMGEKTLDNTIKSGKIRVFQWVACAKKKLRRKDITMAEITELQITKGVAEAMSRQIYDWVSNQAQEDYADFLLPLPEASSPFDFSVKLTLLVDNQDLAINDGRVPTTYWLIRDDHRIIGYAKTRVLLDPNTLHEGGHIRLALDPDYRRKGYGRQVLERLMKYVQGQGVEDILMSTFVDNIAGSRLIQAVGGKEESVGESWQFPGHQIVRYWIHF